MVPSPHLLEHPSKPTSRHGKMSRRCPSHMYVVVALIISTIALYSWFTVSGPRSLFDIAEHGKAAETEPLALILHPEDHIHRSAKTIHQSWNISSDDRAPDGVRKRVYLINGHFPGPLIEARSGDEIVIHVYNGLVDEDAAIHWHGLSLRGSNDMDGVVGLTQSGIQPGKSFTYRFNIGAREAGTFWYHAHSELQRADGLYGPLVVHSPNAVKQKFADDRDEDLALMIGDWYHRSAEQVQNYYTDWKNFGNEPAPDSILLNGRGSFNCSMAVPARPLDCHHTVKPVLRLGDKRTRLRIINTGALTGFSLSIPGYSMTLFSVDAESFVSHAPRASSVGVLYPGERMDVILERSNMTLEPSLTVILDRENLKFKNFALSPTQHFPIISQAEVTSQSQDEGAISPFFNQALATGPHIPSSVIPLAVDETILLYTKIELLSEFDNIPKGFINRTSWNTLPSSSPPLMALDRNEWNDAFVPEIKSPKWVEIVLNNMDDKGHPFHLHGNSFYVLSIQQAVAGQYGFFNPYDPNAIRPELNTANPVVKDTIYVPRRGYVVLRFQADNEGLWLFHCHILWHNNVGMGMAFQVSGS